MLVLTRKSDQKIIINNNIEITILKIQRDQVSIGIKAPDSVPIFREELLKKNEAVDCEEGVDETTLQLC